MEIQKALIYCRVSSDQQVRDGHGLDSQEYRCREYAKNKGYEVECVFHDDYSGGGDFMNRPAMSALLSYLDTKIFTDYVVIFDDLKRLDRDSEYHWPLRRALQSRNAKPESPNFVFEDTPEGEFVETIMVAQAQLERKQNRRQVMQKMKVRIDKGFWPFNPPPGLKNIKDPLKGKILAPAEPLASIYKKAIEKYRDYELNTLEEVRNFISGQYGIHGINRTISIHGTKNILSEILYSGYLEYEAWEVKLRKGNHIGFISFDTYQTVQARLAGKAKPQVKKSDNPQFPLRRFITCPLCCKPLTGSTPKGRYKAYSYYFCKQKGCPLAWKAIPKKELEDKFRGLLNDLTPAQELTDLAHAILLDVWQERLNESSKYSAQAQKQLEDVDNQIKSLANRIAKTRNDSVAEQYELEIENLLKQKSELQTNAAQQKYTQEKFGTASKLVFEHIKNPVAIWDSDVYEDRRLLLNMYFSQRITYSRENGFGTADLPLLIRVLGQKDVPKIHLVDVLGKNWSEIYNWIIQTYSFIASTLKPSKF